MIPATSNPQTPSRGHVLKRIGPGATPSRWGCLLGHSLVPLRALRQPPETQV